MTHEFKQILETAHLWDRAGRKLVMATVVKLDGSSYRRPGVRMLLSESGDAVGAVSGGCVEKEIHRQAKSVFETGVPKLMTYDGRFRLGCDGVLYILLEAVQMAETLYREIQKVLESRQPFQCESYYFPAEGIHPGMGSVLVLEDRKFPLSEGISLDQSSTMACYSQELPPLFQLYIFGAEHDAVALSQAAKLLGWRVTIVASPDEQKTLEFFPGAESMICPGFDELETDAFDSQTALILMTHSFNKDVRYLKALQSVRPVFLGLLGPSQRREEIFDKLLEFVPDIDPAFIDQIHGPVGINIGAESAQEIAVSIVAEILSVVRKQQPVALKYKSGRIHE